MLEGAIADGALDASNKPAAGETPGAPGLSRTTGTAGKGVGPPGLAGGADASSPLSAFPVSAALARDLDATEAVATLRQMLLETEAAVAPRAVASSGAIGGGAVTACVPRRVGSSSLFVTRPLGLCDVSLLHALGIKAVLCLSGRHQQLAARVAVALGASLAIVQATGAADTGATDTGTADTGAADTGAADTGEGKRGAVETGGEQPGESGTVSGSSVFEVLPVSAISLSDSPVSDSPVSDSPVSDSPVSEVAVRTLGAVAALMRATERQHGALLLAFDPDVPGSLCSLGDAGNSRGGRGGGGVWRLSPALAAVAAMATEAGQSGGAYGEQLSAIDVCAALSRVMPGCGAEALGATLLLPVLSTLEASLRANSTGGPASPPGLQVVVAGESSGSQGSAGAEALDALLRQAGKLASAAEAAARSQQQQQAAAQSGKGPGTRPSGKPGGKGKAAREGGDEEEKSPPSSPELEPSPGLLPPPGLQTGPGGTGEFLFFFFPWILVFVFVV
ncbi:hypothetical protein T492DRAFT_339276 [Pavlovales sp. CCMP2436]|nr:hypothetical protein T492DRAFT_339276 [Pavlovales sp. CCMP2436]